MAKIVDVRFRSAGKTYRFDTNELPIRQGDDVIVDSAKGKAFAHVVTMPYEQIAESKKPLKKVIRLANEEDREKVEANREKEKEAYAFCKERIVARELDMKLVATECAFNARKMTFYFTADERVDFRELVKDLAARLHMRIEMRQIGVRDETTIIGGIGMCGRELCCCTYLTDFAPVSIKMAKTQNLSLNPEKISGVCGRLMCCLRNEAETYEELNKTVPKMGERVRAVEGEEGKVVSLDVIRQKVKVLIDIDEDDKEIKEFDAVDLIFKQRGRKPKSDQDEPKKDNNDQNSSKKHSNDPGAQKRNKNDKGGVKKNRRNKSNGKEAGQKA